MIDTHRCHHMCKHYVAERAADIGNVELRGVFVLMNAADEFVHWMMRDVSCFRITGTTYRAGGEHYDSFLLLERRDNVWHRRTITGWTKCEEPAPKKTATIVLKDIKSSDGWGPLISALGYGGDENEERRNKFFEFHEYASIELTIDEDMNVVRGRILPRNG